MSYLRNEPGKRETPQSDPYDETQVENRAGGFVFNVSPEAQLRRWLILGSEGGTYYASERETTLENVRVLKECDPLHAVDIICDVSCHGLAPKNDPAIFALAYYSGHQNPEVRKYALSKLPVVCRTATHLFHFAAYVEKHRGWGRSLRRAVGQWYADKPTDQIAFQAVKYRQRDGYTHRDLLRLAHPAAHVSSGNPTVFDSDSATRDALLDWICGRKVNKDILPPIVRGFRRINKPDRKPGKVAALIQEYNLPWEAVPDEYKNSPEVWEALWENMPLGALIRQLPTLTRVGLMKPMGSVTNETVRRLTDPNALKKARIHPLNLLTAQLVYRMGRSLRGSTAWKPVRELVDALDEAFYASFGYLEPSGKRMMLAIDVSGSMTYSSINGIQGLTPRVAAGVMAMAQAAVGDPYVVTAFSSDEDAMARLAGGRRSYRRNTEFLMRESDTWAIREMSISPRMRMDSVADTMARTQAGGTDCALPMLYALKEGLEVDAFVIYTDNETWQGRIHPTQALEKYREKTGINARLVASAFTATRYSVADDRDPRQMNVVGLDSSTPQLITDFAAGRV